MFKCQLSWRPSPHLPTTPELARSKLVWDGSSVSWVLEHERIKRNCFSPLDSHQKLTRYGDSHRIVSTSGANAAYMALLAPFPMASLMDADDAKTCLTLVSEKVVTEQRAIPPIPQQIQWRQLEGMWVEE